MNDDEGFGGILNWGLGFLGRIESMISLGILLVSVIAVLSISTSSPSTKLTCTREGPAGVRCNFEERIILWPVTVGGLGYVTGAINEQKCNNSGCMYRVVLMTREGKRPLRDEYSTDSKADFVNKLNSFIVDRKQARIDLFDSGAPRSQYSLNYLFPLLILGLIVLGLTLLFLGYRLRRKEINREQ